MVHSVHRGRRSTVLHGAEEGGRCAICEQVDALPDDHRAALDVRLEWLANDRLRDQDHFHRHDTAVWCLCIEGACLTGFFAGNHVVVTALTASTTGCAPETVRFTAQRLRRTYVEVNDAR